MSYLLTIGIAVAWFFFAVASGQAETVSVIVHKSNPIDELSHRDLVRVFKLDRQFWDDGKRIYLIMQESGSFEKQVMLEKVYMMRDEELKKFWLAKIFRGEISSFPKTLASNEGVKRFISEVPHAIGFVDSKSVDDTVKVLRIDGKMPHEAGYLLSSAHSRAPS